MKFLIAICLITLTLTISATPNTDAKWDYNINISADYIELESVKPKHIIDASIFSNSNKIYRCKMKANGQELLWDNNKNIVENSDREAARFLIGLWGINNYRPNSDIVLTDDPIKTQNSVIQLLKSMIYDNNINDNTRNNKHNIHLLVFNTKLLQGNYSISGNSFILWNTIREPNPPEFLRKLKQGTDYVSVILFPENIREISHYKVNWKAEKSLSDDQTSGTLPSDNQTSGTPADNQSSGTSANDQAQRGTEKKYAQSDFWESQKSNAKFDNGKIEDYVKNKYSCVLDKQAFEIDIKNNIMYQTYTISVDYRKEVYTDRIQVHRDSIEYALNTNTYNVTGKHVGKTHRNNKLLSKVIPKLKFKGQDKAIRLLFSDNQLEVPEIIDPRTISFYSGTENVWLKAVLVKGNEIKIKEKKRPNKFKKDPFGLDIPKPVTAEKENCIIRDAEFKEVPKLVLSLANTEFSKDYLSATYTIDIVSEEGDILEYKTRTEKIQFNIEAQKIPVKLVGNTNFPELKSLRKDIFRKLKFKYDTFQLKFEKGEISFPTLFGNSNDITLERVEFPFAEVTGAEYKGGKFIITLKKRADSSIIYSVARKTPRSDIAGYTANLYLIPPHENKIILSNEDNLIRHSGIEYELEIKHEDYQTKTLSYTNSSWPENEQILMEPKIVSFNPVLSVEKDKYNVDYSNDTPKFNTISHPKLDFPFQLDLKASDTDVWEFPNGTSTTKIYLDEIQSRGTVKKIIQRKSERKNFSLRFYCDMPLEYEIRGFEKDDDENGRKSASFDFYAKFPYTVLQKDRIEVIITKPSDFNICLDGEKKDFDILTRKKQIIFKQSGTKKIYCHRIPSFDFFYFDIADVSDKRKMISYFEEKIKEIRRTDNHYFMYLSNDRNYIIADDKDEYKNILNGIFNQRNTPPAIVVSDFENIENNLNKDIVMPLVKKVTFHLVLSDGNFLSERGRNRIFTKFLKQFDDWEKIKIVIYEQSDVTKIKKIAPENDIKPINY